MGATPGRWRFPSPTYQVFPLAMKGGPDDCSAPADQASDLRPLLVVPPIDGAVVKVEQPKRDHAGKGHDDQKTKRSTKSRKR